jgi:hypothetical protein
MASRRHVRVAAVALSGAVFAALCALSPSRAQAQCAQWSAEGQRNIKQNNGVSIAADVRQDKMSLKGTAGYVTNLGKYLKGTIHGVIQNNNCNFVILWESGDRSSYEGKIASDGRAEGLQYSVKNPSAKFHWYFTSPLQCAGATAAVTPRPIKTIGKGVGPSTAAVPPPVTQTNVPGIAANPTTVSIPAGQSEGTATLTWDAGPAHPYAEVWVQVDGGDAQFVVERAKGTRSVTVQRGQTYRYTLSDSGAQLASVTIRTK